MFETKLPLDLRIASAARYYDFLGKVKDLSWIDILSEVEANNVYGIPEVLVLLDPKYHDQLNATDPRGPRTFAPAGSSAKCRSNDVWGYACPFNESRIHVDHMFPQSRGGSTHQQNAMYLCSEHNMSKHTDIHLILWEQIPAKNEWVTKSIKHLLDFASRLTNEKLYMPSTQLSKL